MLNLNRRKKYEYKTDRENDGEDKVMIINLFQSRNSGFDEVVLAFDWTWEKIVSLYDIGHKSWGLDERKSYSFAEYVTETETPEKYDNVAEYDFYEEKGVYYPERKPIHLVQNHALVLNYHTDEHIDVILEKFKKYDYVYCTTWRHLRFYGQNGLAKDFRLIIPFHKPISSTQPLDTRQTEHILESRLKSPDSRFSKSKITKIGYSNWGDWYKIIESLVSFAGDGCHIKSFNPNEKYDVPIASEDHIHLAEIGHNTGERLNWEEFDQGDIHIVKDWSLKAINADYSHGYLKPTPIQRIEKPIKTISLEELKQQMENREPTEPEYVPFYDKNGRPLHFVKSKNEK